MASSSRSPRVLIIGKDARTDAIASACARSPQRPELFGLSETRMPGLVQKCREVFIGSLTDQAVVLAVADQVAPDLVIIGPEEPLAAGYADVLAERSIPVFGPSKSWARQLVDQYGIPGNPEYRVFESGDGLRRYMEDLETFVVKPDGLTAGKGVRVFGEHLHSIDEAFEYASSVIAASGRVQIEERLEGEEFSLQTITDGTTVIHCPLVQDHKRAYAGDQGPNTGGMGSYSCADFSLPFLDADDVADAKTISERVIDALAHETGRPYCGVLYGGFMATRDGVRLIEYNCRFGDPEAMNVLPLLNADFVEMCLAATQTDLASVDYTWEAKATVCKYIVPQAYPDASPVMELSAVPQDHESSRELRWYWAACSQEGRHVFLTSSRSGAYVGIGDTLERAEQISEAAATELERQNADAVRHRSDIGRNDIVTARITHMESIRSRPAAFAAHHA
jgi:phosphoribosylamine--glycine ligase